MNFVDCLPLEVATVVQALVNVRELRIRNGGYATVNVAGTWYYVGKSGLLSNFSRAIVLGDVCDGIVNLACNKSLYAYEKLLAQGYFTMEGGVRVGVSGVMSGGASGVFQKYTSLCFRIPHAVNCATQPMLDACSNGNLAIIGPPGSGKTTLLRDIAQKLSLDNNVLIIDERGEIVFDDNLFCKRNCDVIKYCNKQYAFEYALRAMAPQYVVFDELSLLDKPFVQSATSSGISLICSAHGSGMGDFVCKFGAECNFCRAIVLSVTMGQFSSQLCNFGA